MISGDEYFCEGVCENGGRCRPVKELERKYSWDAGFYCECVSGFSGHNCEQSK